jgi:pimeloyl-ACP methyl ester carboxylesterase
MAKRHAFNIVLVHGGFVDGSGWEDVYKILKHDGYEVSVVQNSTESLGDDVAATKLVLAEQDRPVILVGHSYGGAVITEAGNDPKVAGLVYIAAFAPSDGESVNTLIKNPQPGDPVPPILPPKDGHLFLDRAKFRASFAGDVDAERAEFMADAQVPWGLDALGGTISQAAWKTKPSWYLVTTDDKMIPPRAQRMMSKRAGATVVEQKGSHAVYVSHPEAVVALIEKAATSATPPSGARHRDQRTADAARARQRSASTPLKRSQPRNGSSPTSAATPTTAARIRAAPGSARLPRPLSE